MFKSQKARTNPNPKPTIATKCHKLAVRANEGPLKVDEKANKRQQSINVAIERRLRREEEQRALPQTGN